MNADVFGPESDGTVPILLDDVQCTGMETDISSCPSNRQHNCRHSDDVGVICKPGQCR